MKYSTLWKAPPRKLSHQKQLSVDLSFVGDGFKCCVWEAVDISIIVMAPNKGKGTGMAQFSFASMQHVKAPTLG